MSAALAATLAPTAMSAMPRRKGFLMTCPKICKAKTIGCRAVRDADIFICFNLSAAETAWPPPYFMNMALRARVAVPPRAKY
jgi:hypothetical protein